MAQRLRTRDRTTSSRGLTLTTAAQAPPETTWKRWTDQQISHAHTHININNESRRSTSQPIHGSRLRRRAFDSASNCSQRVHLHPLAP
jgi:hypothetical protein